MKTRWVVGFPASAFFSFSQRNLSHHSVTWAIIKFRMTHPPIRPAVILARRQVVLQVEITNGLKINQNVMSGNLIKHAPLLRKPRFTNANNAHPVHRNPQRQVKSSKSWRSTFLTFSYETSTRRGVKNGLHAQWTIWEATPTSARQRALTCCIKNCRQTIEFY